MSSTMISFFQLPGPSKVDDRLSRRSGNYEPPRVLSETELLLETDLAASVWQMMNIEIVGQGMKGLYFEEGDIVTDDNYWGD